MYCTLVDHIISSTSTWEYEETIILFFFLLGSPSYHEPSVVFLGKENVRTGLSFVVSEYQVLCKHKILRTYFFVF